MRHSPEGEGYGGGFTQPEVLLSAEQERVKQLADANIGRIPLMDSGEVTFHPSLRHKNLLLGASEKLDHEPGRDTKAMLALVYKKYGVNMEQIDDIQANESSKDMGTYKSTTVRRIIPGANNLEFQEFTEVRAYPDHNETEFSVLARPANGYEDSWPDSRIRDLAA